MRKIDTALQNSKTAVNESNSARISQEHALVVETVKREFGVTNFANESEDVRKSLKSLILEMWNSETGLTEKGKKFVNEGKNEVLTPDSTEDQICHYCKNKFLGPCRSYFGGTFSYADLMNAFGETRSFVLKSTKNKVTKTFVKECFAECLAKAASAKFKVRLVPGKQSEE